MNREFIIRVIESPTDANIETLFDDRDSVLIVDWCEEDDAIVEYAEQILRTGTLSAEIIHTDNNAGFEMYINYKEKCLQVPLLIGCGDRHITIVSLNEILNPDYEIRYCIDSNGTDTAALLPLPLDVWHELETQYGNAVAKRFYRPAMKPNWFTDLLEF